MYIIYMYILYCILYIIASGRFFWAKGRFWKINWFAQGPQLVSAELEPHPLHSHTPLIHHDASYRGLACSAHRWNGTLWLVVILTCCKWYDMPGLRAMGDPHSSDQGAARQLKRQPPSHLSPQCSHCLRTNSKENRVGGQAGEGEEEWVASAGRCTVRSSFEGLQPIQWLVLFPSHPPQRELLHPLTPIWAAHHGSDKARPLLRAVRQVTM